MMKHIFVFCSILFLLTACNGKGCRNMGAKAPEDLQAKRMLQGIWKNEDNNDISFRAKGDTIFDPDTTSLPVYCQIIGDTLVLYGANVAKYAIVKQTNRLFEFKNQNGDVVKLVKSNDPDDIQEFSHHRQVILNQNRLIKRDTVVVQDAKRYHCYVQVNPTTYKVFKTVYNDEGVEVDNVYYDNIVHVSVFQSASKVFSKDFYKNDFVKYVPRQFLRQSILSDISFVKIDENGVHFVASLCIPDSYLSYVVTIGISFRGGMAMQINIK